MDLQQPLRNKDELLRQISEDRAVFDAIVERVPRDRLAEPGLPGGWSVKDVLVHIAWGDREAAGAARARALVGSDLWSLPQDERNAAVIEASRRRSTEEVLREYRDSYHELLAALDALTEEELNEPDRMTDLAKTIPGWRPWRALYDPGHYADHGRTIDEWLKATR